MKKKHLYSLQRPNGSAVKFECDSKCLDKAMEQAMSTNMIRGTYRLANDALGYIFDVNGNGDEAAYCDWVVTRL